MSKNLKKLDDALDEVLEDDAQDLDKDLLERKSKKQMKFLAKEIAENLSFVLDKNKNETVKAIKEIKPNINVEPTKVEPKIIMRENPAPKVTVKPPEVIVNVEGREEAKESVGLLRRMAEFLAEKVLRVKITGISKKDPLPVTLIYDGQGYRAMGGGGFPSFKKDSDGYLQVSVGDAYKISDKDDDASPNYYGFVSKNGAWYILKETVLAGADTYRYAKGSSDYTTNWTNRASLSYDYYHNVF
jgi:hypothetical protein